MSTQRRQATWRVGRWAKGRLCRTANVVNEVQNATLEGLTRLARASRVKIRENERKKDSDRAALEEERHRGCLPGDARLQRGAEHDRGAAKVRSRGRGVDAAAGGEYAERAGDTGVFTGTG